jgi:4-hydroxy-tetrahydrodipicolinate reductase
MKIALHGYGKMGRAVEKVARERNHEIVAIVHRGSDLNGAEVIIDFSQAGAVTHAVDLALANGVDLVIGTTGWIRHPERSEGSPPERSFAVSAAQDDVAARIGNRIGCVYASNFSPGANVVFALARRAGELFARFPQYAAGIEERHHAQKKDAPSGTALRIAKEVGKLNPPIVSSRVGSEFGLHTLFFDSPDDLIEITHRARGRDGFARGAVLAAELIRGKKGFIAFDELVMA